VGETQRRREKQMAFNAEHHITPRTIKKEIPDLVKEFGELNPTDTSGPAKVDIIENIADIIARLRKQMLAEAEALNFEEATRLRDRIRELERLELTSESES